MECSSYKDEVMADEPIKHTFHLLVFVSHLKNYSGPERSNRKRPPKLTKHNRSIFVGYMHLQYYTNHVIKTSLHLFLPHNTDESFISLSVSKCGPLHILVPVINRSCSNTLMSLQKHFCCIL